MELGSGTGLVGLVFAACGASVVLMELDAALPLLQYNVNANEAAIGASSAVTAHTATPPPRVYSLPWGEPLSKEISSVIAEEGPFDIVVGADVVYGEELFAPLLETINLVCCSELLLCRLQRGTDRLKIERFYSALGPSVVLCPQEEKITTSGGIKLEGLPFTLDSVLVGGARPGLAIGDQDSDLSQAFVTLTDQRLPFELLRATRCPGV